MNHIGSQREQGSGETFIVISVRRIGCRGVDPHRRRQRPIRDIKLRAGLAPVRGPFHEQLAVDEVFRAVERIDNEGNDR